MVLKKFLSMLKVLKLYIDTYYLRIDVGLGIRDEGWCTPYINVCKDSIWLSIQLSFLNVYLEIYTRFSKYEDS